MIVKHPPLEPPGALDESESRRAPDTDGRAQRRRASRSLWEACEALLVASEPRALGRSLDQLLTAFGCEAAALDTVGPDGELQRWCARGRWNGSPGDLRACLTVPLLRRDERVGTLALRLPAGKSWTPGQLALIRTAAGALGAALGARIELQRLRNEPGRDSLTGVADARGFQTRLRAEMDRARRHGLPVGLVTVDLDRFAALNARHGRRRGDRVLQETALVLRLTLRESDTLARLGGNRFAAILPEAELGPSRRCAERLLAALENHRFPVVGRVSASCGVAACPRSGVDALELLQSADKALEIAKKAGRRRVAAVEATHVH